MPRDFVQYAFTPFAALPEDLRCRAFGVEYARLEDGQGGTMYVTAYGWPLLEHLCPMNWWDRQQYAERGERLPEGTGTVYRVAAPGFSRRRPEMLVVKFSRFAQDVPLQVSKEMLGDLPKLALDSAEFLTPFEEFGALMELRGGGMAPHLPRILTKRPLAVYCTPPTHPLWRLGRQSSRLHREAARLAADQAGQAHPVTLEEAHEYIVLFAWVDGDNAAECCRRGMLSEEELHELTRRVTRELDDRGFRVLDNKPAHFILRTRADGTLMRRNGQLVYALVDFELLERTEAHEERRRATKAS